MRPQAATIDHSGLAAGPLVGKICLALGAFLSGFVINEPAPYELYMVALIAVWFLFGLKISATVTIPLILLIFFNIGGMIALTTMDTLVGGDALYVAVSLFLGLSAVFFAAVIEEDDKRLPIIFKAYLFGALITALLGILGYFGAIPSAESFIRYSRAKGAFQDPNVFGPYLILPTCFLVYQMLKGNLSTLPIRACGFLILSFAVFLSFSRAAWGLYAFSMIMIVFLMLLQERTQRFRFRIIVLGLAGFVAVGISLAIALQFEQVSDLFSTRAQLVQEYDSARFGRFARYGLGLSMAMEKPFGIGPVNFGKIYGEDTHNIWLKALLDYGWIGFLSFAALVVWTIAAGFKCLLRNRPWQPYFLCTYVVFVGHILIGTVIDIDHWRHFYILIGILWGCIALEHRAMRTRPMAVTT